MALPVLCFVVFGATLNGNFLSWDDPQHFWLNPHLVAGDWPYFWRHPHYGLYAPVTYTLWTWIYALTQEPWAFHFLNLVLHAANAVLVYVFVRRTLNVRAAAGFFAAAIFALHPLQSEPVAWISGGRDLLAALFGLSAACLLSRRPIGATALFALGLLAKPSLAPLAPALLVFPNFPRRWLIAWCALGAAALTLTYALQAPGTDPRLEATTSERFLIALDSLGFYFRSIAWPYPLSFNYGRRIENVLNNHLFLLGAMSVVAAAIVLFLFSRFRPRETARAAAFALILLLPVLGFVPFAGQAQSTVYDRYAYLPLIGFGMLAAGIAHYRWARAAIALVLIVYGTLSFERARDWLNNRALYESALAARPTNYFALNNLGIEEIADKNYAAAERLLRQAWEARPKEALAPSNLAHALWLQNNLGAILKEIKPLTETDIFLNYNQREVEALSLIFRMTARALNATLDRAGAARAYERARGYRPDDLDLAREVEIFANEK